MLYLQDILKEETIKRIKKVNPNFSYIDLMSMANGAIRPAGASYRDELSTGKYHDNGHESIMDIDIPSDLTNYLKKAKKNIDKTIPLPVTIDKSVF